MLRSDARGDSQIYELKKLVESQLKQIIVLQKEVELARNGAAGSTIGGPSGSVVGGTPAKAADPLAGKEIESLKYQLGEQRQANDELINERRNLMEMMEGLEGSQKEHGRAMEKALSKQAALEKDLEEKSGEIEEIRSRVTKVAELFERKEIKQKYSFEVLCDFIHDKAKRLFTKYENASKEKKVMQEEKSFYFQRKVD